jgi:glycosyltransferase involved in cell wall biosynthesis
MRICRDGFSLMSIRVLHCIHSLSGGGAERQLQVLVAASESAGIAPGIFCVNDKGGELISPSVPIFKSKHSIKYNYSLFASLHEAMCNFQPNVIHAWLPGSMTIPAMLVAFAHRVPSVFSYRSTMFFRRPLTVPEYLCALMASSGIVSNNPIERSNLAYRFLYKWKRGVVIKNAVDVDACFRKQLTGSTPDSTRTILFAGRIMAAKNWRCLLRAMPLIDAQHSYRLTICGDGEDAREFRKLVSELKLQDKVTLLGYRKDVYAIMQSADVLVLPSWYEGMPNVLLEALAIGIPCIVSDIPSHRDLIGDSQCAKTFNPNSPAELAARINELFSNPSCALKMARAGWNIAEAYTPRAMAERYRNFYSDMMAGRSGAITSYS